MKPWVSETVLAELRLDSFHFVENALSARIVVCLGFHKLLLKCFELRLRILFVLAQFESRAGQLFLEVQLPFLRVLSGVDPALQHLYASLQSIPDDIV